MLLVYGLCRCVGHIFLFKNESLDAHVNTRELHTMGSEVSEDPPREHSPPQTTAKPAAIFRREGRPA